LEPKNRRPPPHAPAGKPIVYTIGKMKFVVQPVYKAHGETIGAILQKLMQKDVENP